MRSLNALADPTRQRIVEILARRPLPAGEIANRFEMSAPAISQHLKVLREARLVRVRREAQRRIYELNPDGLGELTQWVHRLHTFWSRRLDALESAMKNHQEENRK